MASFYNWKNEKLDTSIEENLPRNKCTAEPKSALDLELLQDTYDKGISILILAPFGSDSNKSFCFSVTDLKASIKFSRKKGYDLPYNFFTAKQFTKKEANQIYKFLDTVTNGNYEDEDEYEEEYEDEEEEYEEEYEEEDERERMIMDFIERGANLEFESDEFKNDKEIVLAAIDDSGGLELKFASDELKKDKEVVLAAVNDYGEALEFASDELKKDKDVVLAAVNDYGGALEFASDELKKDEDIVLAAVKQDGWALEFASDELKNNKKVVLAAVNQDGTVLMFVSEKLKNDRKVVLAAINNGRHALRFASDEMKLLYGYIHEDSEN